jgi:hypothetical protein
MLLYAYLSVNKTNLDLNFRFLNNLPKDCGNHRKNIYQYLQTWLWIIDCDDN